MQDLEGKVAVVTGGGSGIGRGLAITFANAGMKVAVADVEESRAEEVVAEIRAAGGTAIGIGVDVSDRASMRKAADRVYAELGSCDVLCNNAGVITVKRAQEALDSDWDWTLAVNLHGVVNGIQAFLPRMLSSGRGGHIVNTASIAGMFAGATGGLISYTTSKYAVVGLSESLREDLAPDNIGVSVLCPGGVTTRIMAAGRNRPERFGGPEEPRRIEGAAPGVQQGMDPMDVAALVLRAVKENKLYVFTHPQTRGLVEMRHKDIMDGFDWAANG
jgi:NAD(P)-dependent dehydrogenase (short-subunit alcohol dehydrogenase family)